MDKKDKYLYRLAVALSEVGGQLGVRIDVGNT